MPRTLEQVEAKMLALQKEIGASSNKFAEALNTARKHADLMANAYFELGRQEVVRDGFFPPNGGKRKTSRNNKKKGTRKGLY